MYTCSIFKSYRTCHTMMHTCTCKTATFNIFVTPWPCLMQSAIINMFGDNYISWLSRQTSVYPGAHGQLHQRYSSYHWVFALLLDFMLMSPQKLLLLKEANWRYHVWDVYCMYTTLFCMRGQQPNKSWLLHINNQADNTDFLQENLYLE